MDVPAELKNLPKPVEKPKMSLADAKEWVTDFGTTDPKNLNEKQQALLAEAKQTIEKANKPVESSRAETPILDPKHMARVINLTPEMRARLQAVRAPAEAPKATTPQRLETGVSQHLKNLENQWRQAA